MGVRVTAVAVSVHCVGIVDGSWAYSDQSGVGTAEPTQMSWVCALDSPGALSAAAYSAVGVRLRKSPTPPRRNVVCGPSDPSPEAQRSEEHTSELQSRLHLVCRLLLEKKKE